jgi:flagellar biosynthetic protein FliO
MLRQEVMIAQCCELLGALGGAITEESLQQLGAVAPPASALPEGETDFWLATLRMIAALSAVLALVVLAAWAAKRYLPAAAGRSVGDERIDVLNSRTLGLRRSLILARVRGRVVLLGATPQQISCLTEWDEGADWAAPASADEDEQSVSSAIEEFQSVASSRRRPQGKNSP